jgi:23S rRNA (uracil1939-C5)-methyltransferase
MALEGAEIARARSDVSKRGAEVQLRIRGIGAGGVGVGDLPDGRIVFVPRTAPGDQVSVEILEERARWARGVARAILDPGEARREAPCPRYDECNGCSLQHLEYGRQLTCKGRIVGDALRRIGRLSTEDPVVEGSPLELGYRNKATMTLRRLRGGRVVAGFHEQADRRRIVDIGPECLLLSPDLTGLWRDLRASWGPEASLLPQGRELRLTLRAGREEGALLIRGGRGNGRPEELLDAVPGLGSIWREGRGGGVRHLVGGKSMEVVWMGDALQLVGGAFLQVNSEAGALLHRFVLEEAGEPGRRKIVDAYCGAGVLGRRLASEGNRVLGIEADPLAVAEARRGAPEGFEVVHGRVEESIEGVLPADLVILNPPRTGLDPRVPEALGRRPAKRVIYVSCDPGTLARDLARLVEPYEVGGVRSFDLFPQTSHVETVVTLRKREA